MKQSNSDGPRPEDFPLGSIESRAAARALGAQKARSGFRIRIVLIGHGPENCEGACCNGTCGLITGRLVVRDGEAVEEFWA